MDGLLTTDLQQDSPGLSWKETVSFAAHYRTIVLFYCCDMRWRCLISVARMY